MDETQVCWVLSKETQYLQRLLNESLTKQLGSELTTTFGRLDLAYKTEKGNILLIELETVINSEAKLNHALEQVKRYSKFSSESTPSRVTVLLLYAEEGTPEKFHRIIERACEESGVRSIRYSMLKIKKLYDRQMQRITLNSGAALSRPVALGVSSLSWLLKIMTVFAEKDVEKIPWSELMTEYNSKTHFYVLKRLAEDFELITKHRTKSTNYLKLTPYGRRYVESVPERLIPATGIEDTPDENGVHLLTPLEIRRLLIEILLNNNFTKTKISIFHFLRYINMTGGELLPKRSSLISPDELQYLNNFLSASYNAATLKGHFQQLYKYCNELGMIERITCKGANYDKAILTSLGSRVLGCFELNLHLARERYQIPLQIND